MCGMKAQEVAEPIINCIDIHGSPVMGQALGTGSRAVNKMVLACMVLSLRSEST